MYLIFNKTKIAFTLAEVLITLLIIGVVSSIVIPVLISDTQDAELKTAWKKTFSTFSQVQLQIMNENGGTLKGLFNNVDDIKNAFIPYLNVSRNCISGDPSCWHMPNTWYDSSGQLINHGTSNGIKLNNGTILYFNFNDNQCNPRCCEAYIDINGFKKPNKVNTDILVIRFMENKAVPYSVAATYLVN